MADAERANVTLESGEGLPVLPSWVTKEDNRARSANDLNEAQGHRYVWILLIYIAAPVLIALGGFLWRLIK
jgi:hypothetical protein